MPKEVPEKLQELSGIDLSDGIPSWAGGGTQHMLTPDLICEELGIDRSEIPRERTIIAHAKNRSHLAQLGDRMAVRIECRIGREAGHPIQDRYDATELTENEYYITHSNTSGDPTYTNFYFEPPEGVVKLACEVVRENMETEAYRVPE